MGLGRYRDWTGLAQVQGLDWTGTGRGVGLGQVQGLAGAGTGIWLEHVQWFIWVGSSNRRLTLLGQAHWLRPRLEQKWAWLDQGQELVQNKG